VPVEGIAALLRDYAGTVPSRPYRARPLLGRELNPAPPTLKEDAVTAQPQGEARPRQITVRAVRCLGEGQDCDLPARYQNCLIGPGLRSSGTMSIPSPYSARARPSKVLRHTVSRLAL